MGCMSSSAKKEASFSELGGEEETVVSAKFDESQPITATFGEHARHRLEKLAELDAATKVPFVLVELTGEGTGVGFIEVCGKDEYGIYAALDKFFTEEWDCTLIPDDESTEVPFCSAKYAWPGFKVAASDIEENEKLAGQAEGLNNMGMMTMRLVDFVCQTLSWTLAVVNTGNLGLEGEIRETQIIFKAPHPMNIVVPYIMVELRSAGFIEISCNLSNTKYQDFLECLYSYFEDRFSATQLPGHEDYCDKYFQAGDGVFAGSCGSLDSNFGLLTTMVIDFISSSPTFPGWTLVTSNFGLYGKASEHCEQQIVFRRDLHPLSDSRYVLVVLNEIGNIEINGHVIEPEVPTEAPTEDEESDHVALDIFKQFHEVVTTKWRCKQDNTFIQDDYQTTHYKWRSIDMIEANANSVRVFELNGYEMVICSQQVVKEEGRYVREQQLLFRKAVASAGTDEPTQPHLFVEFYGGETDLELAQTDQVNIPANQYVQWRVIGPRKSPIIAKFQEEMTTFVTDVLDGEVDDSYKDRYKLTIFLTRGRFANNMGQWTMRFTDFLVDKLGWSFIVCSLCNLGDHGERRLQQMVFRYDDDKRSMPVSKVITDLDRTMWEDVEPPDYWISGVDDDTVQKVVPCNIDEKDALQTMLDATFLRILTRDRTPDKNALADEEMPYRVELVEAFRSEHLWLNARLQKARLEADFDGDTFSIKTSDPETMITTRLEAGEAYLYHGTNPSSAMSILKTGFLLDHSGVNRGAMFGDGVYLAECSSKSDEYGKDDGGNTFPCLNALLLARCFIGKPYIVDAAGDHVRSAKRTGCHSIVGDRESKVGTYREFIVFNEDQVYPEFTIIYRRVYDKTKIPPSLIDALVKETKGTTGRFWQIRSPVTRRWHNVPAMVNNLLNDAVQNEESEVNVKLHGTDYIFYINKKEAINQRTSAVAGLRAPMG